jgi:hypothetical protein
MATLTSITESMKSVLSALSLTPSDTIEGMRSLMSILHATRQREATIDSEISAVLDTYALLEFSLPDGIITKEEMDDR